MADPDGERAPRAVRWAVLAMYGGAALTMALTADALALWYFQEYLPASRPTFVHGDSGLSIGASPFFAWLDGLGGAAHLLPVAVDGPNVRAGPRRARATATVLFAVPALVVAREAYGHPHIPHHVTLAGLLRGQPAGRPRRRCPAVAPFLGPVLQGGRPVPLSQAVLPDPPGAGSRSAGIAGR